MTNNGKKLNLPELNTSVGVHGSMQSQEVGGPPCIGVIVGIAILIQR